MNGKATWAPAEVDVSERDDIEASPMAIAWSLAPSGSGAIKLVDRGNSGFYSDYNLFVAFVKATSRSVVRAPDFLLLSVFYRRPRWTRISEMLRRTTVTFLPSQLLRLDLSGVAVIQRGNFCINK